MGELGTSARSAIMPSVSDGVMNRAERSLLDAIAAGELDDHPRCACRCDERAAAAAARRAFGDGLMSLCEGDIVRINERISPRYLAGLLATVLTSITPPRPCSSSGQSGASGTAGSRAGLGA